MSKKDKEPEPTMIYTNDEQKGGTKLGDESIWYMVVDSSEVKDWVKDGWEKKPPRK